MSIGKAPSNSTSPMRRVNTTNITPSHKEPIKLTLRASDRKEFRVEPEYQLPYPPRHVKEAFNEDLNREKEVLCPRSVATENTIKGLVEKTNILEDQMGQILQYVSSIRTEEADLKEVNRLRC